MASEWDYRIDLTKKNTNLLYSKVGTMLEVNYTDLKVYQVDSNSDLDQA